MEKKEIEMIKNDYYHEKLINKVLMKENEELKKIIYGMQLDRAKYSELYPYIDKMRNNIFYRFLRKLKNMIRGK